MFFKTNENSNTLPIHTASSSKNITPSTGINPATNFFLKKATKLAELKDEVSERVLYLLHNGNYAVLTRHLSGSLKPDSLERINPWEATAKFNVQLS